MSDQPSVQEFDPASLVKEKEGTFTPHPLVAGYLGKRMQRCLTKEEHEALLKDHPRPGVASCKVPAVDKYIREFLGKRFPKDMDTDLSKIQGGVMHIVCPLAAAWNSLLEEGVAEDQNLLVPASQVVALIQRTICMVGNVSEMISQLRRTKILQNIETSWSKYGVEDFSGAEDTLFGEDFQTSLTDKVEKETALAKAASITKIIKGRTHLPVTGRMVMVIARFSRGPAYKYGNRQGKNFFPYGSESKKKGAIYQNNQTSGGQKQTRPLFHEPCLPPRQNQRTPQHRK